MGLHLRVLSFSVLFSTLALASACSDDVTGDGDSAEDGSTTVDMPECDPEECWTIKDGFSIDLTQQSGCGDVLLVGINPEETVSMELRVEGLAKAAELAGKPIVTEFTLPDAAVQLRVRTGQHLGGLCTDYYEYEPEVKRLYEANQGSVTVTMRPNPTNEGAIASAEFAGVIFTDIEGYAVMNAGVTRYEIKDVVVDVLIP